MFSWLIKESIIQRRVHGFVKNHLYKPKANSSQKKPTKSKNKPQTIDYFEINRAALSSLTVSLQCSE